MARKREREGERQRGPEQESESRGVSDHERIVVDREKERGDSGQSTVCFSSSLQRLGACKRDGEIGERE